MSKNDGTKKTKKILIFAALFIVGFLAFCTPRDKEDKLLIDLLRMEKGKYTVKSIYVFNIDDTKSKGGYNIEIAIDSPVDEELSNAIMEQIESYTATRSYKELPEKRAGYFFHLDGYEFKVLWLFYSEEEQTYIIDAAFEDKTFIIRDSKLFEIIDEAYKNSVLQQK